jgi:hypothetical protein
LVNGAALPGQIVILNGTLGREVGNRCRDPVLGGSAMRMKASSNLSADGTREGSPPASFIRLVRPPLATVAGWDRLAS